MKTEPTLGEHAINRWLPEKPKLTAATRYDYESQLRFHLLPTPCRRCGLARSTMAM